ncbi:MAG: triple tyrosine motif-containing protein [Ferruginibacter sp.]
MHYIKSFLLIFFPLTVAAQQQMGDFMVVGPETKYLSGFNYRVYQSKTGYLWICTMNSVVRFDGKRYKNFFSDYSNPNSTTDNVAVDIAEDKNGDLWIAGHSKGVARYNQRTGLFKKYPVLSNDNNPIYGINRVINDAEQQLWFGTAGRGLARYNFKKDTFDFFYPEPGYPKDGTLRGFNHISDILQDPENSNLLWLASFHGLYLFNKTAKSFTKYAYPGANPVEDILINDIELQQNGLMWVGTWGKGMKCFDTRQKKYTNRPIPLFADVVNDIKAINDSTLYTACLSQGLIRYHIRSNTADNITPLMNQLSPGKQKLQAVQKISITPDAGIFAGGNFYLFQQHPFYKRLAKNIELGNDPADQLNGIVWDRSKNEYWFSTYVSVYNMDENFVIRKKIKLPSLHGEENLIYGICIDAKNDIWITTAKQGLKILNRSSARFEKPLTQLQLPDSLLTAVSAINTDSAGNLWLYGKEKFWYCNVFKGTGKSFPLQWDAAYRGQRLLKGINLLVSPRGEAWMFSQQGIFIYNQAGFVKHIFKTGNTRNDLASQTALVGGFNRKYRNIWFSGGDGLQVMNYDNYEILANHTVADGLPSMAIRGTVVDSTGRIWVAGASGLGYFDPTKKIWQTYNRFDGLESDYLDQGLFVTANNMIAIPQPNGFSLYEPSDIMVSTGQLKLRITSLTINNEPYADSVLPEFISKLDLAYNKNNIEIEYAAMDWVYPGKTNYRYRIEGIEGQQTWMPNNDAHLNLTALQPGEYVLHLRALGSSGNWSNEIILPITIHPPFWKTAWFIGLVLISLSGMIYWFVKYRIAQVKKLDSMRNNISRNLHDDIGASLSNIGILNELAKRNVDEDSGRAKEYLGRAAEDIQHISENLGDIVWNINPMFDNINNLLIRMKRYAADMTDGRNIHCEFDFPENLDVNLPMDKRRDLYLLFKEAINNLAKHSGAKKAVVRIAVMGSQLKLLIEDDGKGFDASLQKEGNGLHNMKQRAGLLHAKIDLSSFPGKGTRLILEMPI